MFCIGRRAPAGVHLVCVRQIFCVDFVYGTPRASSPTEVAGTFRRFLTREDPSRSPTDFEKNFSFVGRKCTLSLKKVARTLSEGNTQLFCDIDTLAVSMSQKLLRSFSRKATLIPHSQNPSRWNFSIARNMR